MRPRDAPALAGDTGQDRIAGLRVHHAFGSLHRARLGREPDLYLAFQLTRRDMALVVAQRA
jgi:hypothetical protein